LEITVWICRILVYWTGMCGMYLYQTTVYRQFPPPGVSCGHVVQWIHLVRRCVTKRKYEQSGGFCFVIFWTVLWYVLFIYRLHVQHLKKFRVQNLEQSIGSYKNKHMEWNCVCGHVKNLWQDVPIEWIWFSLKIKATDNILYLLLCSFLWTLINLSQPSVLNFVIAQFFFFSSV